LREAFRIASKGDIAERVCCFWIGDWGLIIDCFSF
jgi:hypothetical protein